MDDEEFECPVDSTKDYHAEMELSSFIIEVRS